MYSTSKWHVTGKPIITGGSLTHKKIYLYKIRRPLINLETLSTISICTSNPLCTRWSSDVEQLLHSQRVGLFVTHHGNIVQTVEVGQSLLYKKKRNWILLGKGFPWMMQHLIEVLLHDFFTTVYFSHFQLRWWGEQSSFNTLNPAHLLFTLHSMLLCLTQ